MKKSTRDFLLESVTLLGVSALCVLIAFVALGYDEASISTPSAYAGDGLSAGIIFKGIIENGWYLENPEMGAPFGLSWGPYPMVESSHFFLIKLLGWIFPDYGSVMTVFFLSTFATASITAYVSMRLMGISRILAACGALLFSLQTYHFLRGPHIFLSAYLTVPIFTYLAVALQRRNTLVYTVRGLGISVLGIVLLFASGGGVYYAFFGCMLILAAGVIATAEQSRWQPVFIAFAMTGVVCVGVIANLSAHAAYTRSHVAHVDISARLPQDSEIYGLKLTQLLLPSVIHRQPYLKRITTTYNQNSPLSNENSSSAMGFLASLGFLLSLGSFLVLRKRSDLEPLMGYGVLNLSAFLYGTVGGAGALFAWIVTPQIRGLNRISIFIAFISLCALMWIVQNLTQRLTKGTTRIATITLAVGMAAFGYWDQMPSGNSKLAPVNQQAFRADEASAIALAPHVPPGSRVYQLPYVTFPEHPPQHQEGHYGLARWYLHTRDIAWSYGAMNGTDSDLWIRHMESIPLVERVPYLADSGFQSIMVERRAYADNGSGVEQEIRGVLGDPAFTCPDESCALYRLAQAKRVIPAPLFLAVKNRGWSIDEVDGNGNAFTWSIGNNPSELSLMNPLLSPQKARLRFTVTPRKASDLEISVDDKLLKRWNLGPEQGGSLDETIELPAGISMLQIRSSIKSERAAPADPRMINFRLGSFTIEAVEN